MTLHKTLFAWTTTATCFVALAAALGFGLSAQAQIPVDASGTAALTFGATPTLPASEWATLVAGLGAAGAGTFTTPADVDNAVQTVDQSTINTALLTTAANGTSAGARHNTAGTYILTQPTTVAALVLKATLRNNAAGVISQITVSYDFGVAVTSTTETAPGHRAFFSTTGLPNSWQPLANFSGLNAAAAVSETISVGTWLPGTDIYLLWADDNGATNPDGGYTIDNFAVSGVVIGGTAPLSVTLTAPSANQTVFFPGTVALAATANGSTAANSVSFYTNGALYATDNLAPFDGALTGLPVGTYAIYATAENGGVDPVATSATRTVIVRDEFLSFTGTPLTETLDSMTASGTETPTGWYVGWAPPVTTTTVTVGDGSVAPSGAIAGWNYGTVGDPDRSLGTAPTGTGAPTPERNVEVRIQNNTADNITSFEIHYDGEQWRVNSGANVFEVMTNYVSYDLGATWIETFFDFTSPIMTPAGQLNGKDPANREAGIGGVITPSAPIPPGGVLYVRWYNYNDGGTDGAMAVDNFTFTATTEAFQPYVILTAPADGATFAEGAPITLNASAVMANPVTSVDFFQNGLPIGSDTNSPYSVVFSNATPGPYTLAATAHDSLGNTATSTNPVQVTVNPNVAPSVTVTNPAAGSEFLVGTIVTNVSASASDTDGNITSVEFYLDGVLWMTDTTSAYGFDLADVTAGTHTLSAVAVDNVASRTTNSISITVTNPPDITVVVSNGSDWKYFDLGTDPGATWNTAGYDHASWSNGVAEFGYGDGPGRPERTVVSFGTNASAKFATTYFRKAFVVANPGVFTNLIVRILKDDHAIVFLNGTQIYSDVTNAIVTYQSYVPGTQAEDVYVATNVPVNLLVQTNILAVEVHQEAAGSSDISFDLMLWGEGTAVSPSLTIVQVDATHTTISWGADAVGYTLQGNTGDVGTPADWSNIGFVITEAGSIPVSFPPPDRQFFRLIK